MDSARLDEIGPRRHETPYLQCPECGGSGHVPIGRRWYECAYCDGTGDRFGRGRTQPEPLHPPAQDDQSGGDAS